MKLLNGDCLKIMQDISDKSVDMILCDLPYGMTACKWDSIIPLDLLWKEYKRIIKDNGAIVLTASHWCWEREIAEFIYQANKYDKSKDIIHQQGCKVSRFNNLHYSNGFYDSLQRVLNIVAEMEEADKKESEDTK